MDANRRAFLAATGGSLAVLAGCASGAKGGDGAGTDSPIDSPTGTPTGTPTERPQYELPDHPATTDIEAQPALGAVSRPGVIVAFEDPSCPLCRRFEFETLPTIRTKLVETGKAAFVFRGYPVVYEWGKPATRALEATFDRDEAAFWALARYYFENQGSGGVGGSTGLTTDDVLPKTRGFLAENTDLDAGAVVSDVREGAFDAAVQADFEAGKEAGAGATPAFFLFRDGEFRTKVSGPQDYAVFRSALGF